MRYNSRAVRVRPAREPIALDSIGGRAINILTAGDDEPVEMAPHTLHLQRDS